MRTGAECGARAAAIGWTNNMQCRPYDKTCFSIGQQKDISSYISFVQGLQGQWSLYHLYLVAEDAEVVMDPCTIDFFLCYSTTYYYPNIAKLVAEDIWITKPLTHFTTVQVYVHISALHRFLYSSLKNYKYKCVGYLFFNLFAKKYYLVCR